MNLVPANPTERRIAERVQSIAQEGIGLALTEVRRADAVHAINNQLLDVMHQELKDYREGTEAHAYLRQAVAALDRAERLIRSRGETNGH